MNELENVKVGDLMVVNGSYAHLDCLKEVERITKSQIIVNKRRYWKKNGRLVGDGDWCYGFIKPATEKDIEIINKREQKDKLLTFFRKVVWCTLSLESLQTIYDVVKKEIGNSATKQ